MQMKALSNLNIHWEIEEAVPDFVASVARRLPVAGPVQVRPEVTARYGDLVLVRVAEVNPYYSVLEVGDSEDVILTPGKLMVGALGSRKALRGFSGDPPARLYPGAPLHLLNRGGVIGECTAFRRDWGWPSRVEYVGTVLWNNQPANLKDFALPLVSGPLPEIPAIFVVGTCMEAGKTTVSRELVKMFSAKGFSVNAGKIAGVASQRDLKAMEQNGASQILSFQDFGLPSTAHLDTLVPVAHSIVHYLGRSNPDFITLEMGDGILGRYNVSTLLKDPVLMSRCVSMILCANDLMGVWGALEWLSAHKLRYPILVSGPVTDSAEGIRYIEETWKLPAGNAFDSAGKICTFILKSLMPWSKSE